jgi:cupin 2 domain-containing protein
MTETSNIYSDLPEFPQKDEIFKILSENEVVKIERIVSTGQTTATGVWYEQEWNEFVILLRGNAIISFDDEEIKLYPGDYIDIPAGKRHRVEETDWNGHTVWLAIHYKA